MVEQRRKDPGRKGRPASRGGKTRHARPDAGRSSGAALGRGRGRRAEGAGPRPRRLRRVRGLPPQATAGMQPPRHGRTGSMREDSGE
jgi:hypothetical protein